MSAPPGLPVRSVAHRSRAAVGWALLLVLYLAVRVPALLESAPTYDEPIYIGAGKHMVVVGDPRHAALLYHPPLSYHLTSLPLFALDTPDREWVPGGLASQVGLDTLYESGLPGGAPAAPETVLLLARLPVLLFGLLGMELMRRLGRRLFGAVAGWLAAAAWALHPDVAAQSVQATTDLVAAVAALVLCTAALRWIEAPPDRAVLRGRALGFGAACGLALLAKHTLLFSVGVAAVALVLARRRSRRGGATVAQGSVPRAALAVGAAAFVVWAGYLFSFHPVVPASAAGHAHTATLARITGLAPETVDALAEGVPVPAPEYLRSLADAFLDKARARTGTPWVAYLAGEWRPEGFLLWYPAALLIKTPTSLVILLLGGLAAFPLVRRRNPEAAWLCLALFAGPFLVAVASRLNIGVRHLLPMVPFALLLGCAALALLWERRPKFGVPLAASLGALLVLEWTAAWRDPISFANFPAGGPDHLHRLLADTNLEAGQDLYRVERWAEERGATSVALLLHQPQGIEEREVARRGYLAPLGPILASGRIERIRAEDQHPGPQGDLVAVGESVLVLPNWDELLDVAPLARVNRTRIYRLPPAGAGAR